MSVIFISTSTFGEFDPAPIDLARSAGFEVLLNPHRRTLTAAEVVELTRGAEGLVAGTEPLTEEVLRELPALKVISRCGTGLENVDLKAAEEMHIRVFNTPDAPTNAVAELTVGLMLSLVRRLPQASEATRGGAWKKSMGNLLGRRTVGIVGFGRIGRRVAELLEPFGSRTVWCDIDPNVAPVPYAERFDFDALIGLADIVTLHVSQAGSRFTLGEAELQRMKKGSWIVNTARGSLVDEGALFRALVEGRLAGAALDVFRKEPYEGELRDLPNVILTPHIGSYAREARIEMEMQAVQNLLKGLLGT